MMGLMADRKIRGLLCTMLLLTAAFSALTIWLCMIGTGRRGCAAAAVCACLGLSLFLAVLLYLRIEHRAMEEAVLKIRAYVDGNRDVRIECDDEGERNRLFHEINSLAAILNAHAEKEEEGRRFLKDLISDISHQLKTPLAALTIYNGILQDEDTDPAVRKEFTELSEQELDRMQTLVRNLLKLARLDAGTVVLEKGMEQLAGVMDKVEKQFLYRAGQEGKTLVFSGSDEIGLFCDPIWLSEAVGNLVKNALDHTSAGDVIEVSWRQSASLVQITVRDSGSGIHPEDLPHIFKRFYRSRFSEDTQGIGLGLPLAKAVTEAHGGTLEADSQPGGGAVFTMSFLIPTEL